MLRRRLRSASARFARRPPLFLPPPLWGRYARSAARLVGIRAFPLAYRRLAESAPLRHPASASLPRGRPAAAPSRVRSGRPSMAAAGALRRPPCRLSRFPLASRLALSLLFERSPPRLPAVACFFRALPGIHAGALQDAEAGRRAPPLAAVSVSLKTPGSGRRDPKYDARDPLRTWWKSYRSAGKRDPARRKGDRTWRDPHRCQCNSPFVRGKPLLIERNFNS